jgi:hypothetical protein
LDGFLFVLKLEAADGESIVGAVIEREILRGSSFVKLSHVDKPVDEMKNSSGFVVDDSNILQENKGHEGVNPATKRGGSVVKLAALLTVDDGYCGVCGFERVDRVVGVDRDHNSTLIGAIEFVSESLKPGALESLTGFGTFIVNRTAFCGDRTVEIKATLSCVGSKPYTVRSLLCLDAAPDTASVACAAGSRRGRVNVGHRSVLCCGSY